MTSLQDSNIRSPQIQQTPRGSPAGSITKSPSQFSAVSLLASPSPKRKRVHPDYLKIDDAVPPNKKLNTPTVSLLLSFVRLTTVLAGYKLYNKALANLQPLVSGV